MKAKLQWYWYRLQAMSPEEIAVRLKFSFNKKYWRNRSSWQAPQPKLQQHDWWQLCALPKEITLENESLLQEAEDYLAGKYKLLNCTFTESPLDWHLDPQSGKQPPLEFGLDLNYRDFEVAGNVKNIWEKNRHHHLSVIASAYALTKEEKYAAHLAEQLQSWLAQNPFPLGVNWTSSLELGIRLISWVWIERLLRGSKQHSQLFGDGGIMWSAIYWHQWLITQHYSHGSSANNHLIGEMAGLFIAASHWAVFPESKQWQSLAQNILEQEVSGQTFPSGLNREQAFSYHIFALEFFLLAGWEGDKYQSPYSDNYKNWVRRMLEVIPILVDVGGNLPRYGDGDEGMALQIRPLKSSRLDWLYRLGRQWLGAQVPLPEGDSGLLAASLINLNLADSVGEISPPPNSIALKDAGLYVLSQKRGQPQEIFCLADAGSLGFLGIAAHGHADALSFTLSMGGVPIIIDPGTYVYHADAHWRSYFRGTKAHNTVTVDNLDQSEPGGTFLWKQKAETKVLAWEHTSNETFLNAEHNGYLRLSEGVIHRRNLSLNHNRLEVVDYLEGSGVHNLEWRLHFAPHCEVSLQSDYCVVKWNYGVLFIYLDQKMKWSLLEQTTTGGWFSAGFNLKEPTITLVGAVQMNGNLTLNNSLDLLTHSIDEVTSKSTPVAL